MTMKLVRRSLLVAAASAGLLLTSQPLANAVALPAVVPAPAAPVSPPAPAPAGGTLDSLLGIGTGAVKGAAPVAGLPTP